MNPPAHVVSVSRSSSHSFSKPEAGAITLLAGLGVEGDAHCGVTVKHRSRVALDPTQPNLRQVHLLHSELFDELAENGFTLRPGSVGENVTTFDIALLALPLGTELWLGASAAVRLTGLRNPCMQLDRFQSGLMAAVLGRTAQGALVRKAGVMAIVLHGGPVRAGDTIRVVLPTGPQRALEVV